MKQQGGQIKILLQYKKIILFCSLCMMTVFILQGCFASKNIKKEGIVNEAGIVIETNTPLKLPPSDYCPQKSTRWFTIKSGFDAGKKMFYYDYMIGDEQPVSTIVFIHGNPETSYTYRDIRDTLIKSGKPLRLVAMDHIGFGLSDQATFEMVDMHHSENLLQLIRHLDLNNVTLVVHDWGGPIGIGAFLKDPWRVTSLLVMNTTIFPMPEDGFTYTNYPISLFSWSKIPELVFDSLWGGVAAYAVSNANPKSTARMIFGLNKYLFLHGTGLIEEGTPEYVWSESLRPRNNAKSSKRMVRQTPYWGHGYTYTDPTHGIQDNNKYYTWMQTEVPEYWGPEGQNIKVCGYFGQWDPCGKDSVINQWQEALPQIKQNTHTFSDIGHFIEEDKGEEMAKSILILNGFLGEQKKDKMN